MDIRGYMNIRWIWIWSDIHAHGYFNGWGQGEADGFWFGSGFAISVQTRSIAILTGLQLIRMSNDVVKNWTYRDGLPEILLLFNPVDKSAFSPCLILSCPCTTRYKASIFFIWFKRDNVRFSWRDGGRGESSV
jgi:hypothetical protein